MDEEQPQTPPTPEENKEAMQALCAAFYALNNMLEDRGYIAPRELSGILRRLKTDSPYFNACLASIAANLDARHFRPADRNRPVLMALDGGKAEQPEQ